MQFAVIDGTFTIALDAIATLTLGILILLLGNGIKDRVKALDRFCIPAPVIGGLVFAILHFAGRQSGLLAFNLDLSYQSPFMIAFLTTVGLGASFKVVKQGGKLLILYWILSGILSVAQNIISIGLSQAVGLEPMYGIMAGAISLIGGHASAGSFGITAEQMGYPGALTVATAAATFGLISGGLLGGPLARKLIDKHHLKPDPADAGLTDLNGEGEMPRRTRELSVREIMNMLAIITVCMTLGVYIATALANSIDVMLPSYVGAMFVAVIVRNINDKIHWFDIDMEAADKFGTVCLNIFLSYVLMALSIWELMDMAIPLLIVLAGQVLFISLFTYFVVFRVMGRSFDAAMMVAGMMGHGLGATPNAMANMSAVTEKYGFSRKAYMIVPIVGAFLVEMVSIPNIVFFMNLFG